ncbi:MAG: hypothetical protein KC652_25965 [Cyanobacteria bacterium HKST-UBA01]|nr:hypothetical protein [Cyanobacteria bacterium HKST-UBA01]
MIALPGLIPCISPLSWFVALLAAIAGAAMVSLAGQLHWPSDWMGYFFLSGVVLNPLLAAYFGWTIWRHPVDAFTALLAGSLAGLYFVQICWIFKIELDLDNSSMAIQVPTFILLGMLALAIKKLIENRLNRTVDKIGSQL